MWTLTDAHPDSAKPAVSPTNLAKSAACAESGDKVYQSGHEAKAECTPWVLTIAITPFELLNSLSLFLGGLVVEEAQNESITAQPLVCISGSHDSIHQSQGWLPENKRGRGVEERA